MRPRHAHFPAVCAHFRLHVGANAQIRVRLCRAQQNVARLAVLRIVANRIAGIKLARLQQLAGTGEESSLINEFYGIHRRNTSQPAPKPLTEWNSTSCDISAPSLASETSLAPPKTWRQALRAPSAFRSARRFRQGLSAQGWRDSGADPRAMCPHRAVAPFMPRLACWSRLTLMVRFTGLAGTVPSPQGLRVLLKKGKLMAFSFVGRTQARSLVHGREQSCAKPIPKMAIPCPQS